MLNMISWPKFLLIMVGCAAGGFGLASLVMAVVSKRLWDHATT